MTDAIVARVEMVEEATALEKAGGEWHVPHVLAVLGCHISTLYRNAWLMERSVKQPGGVVFNPKDVRLFQANNRGLSHRRRARRGTAR